MFDFGDGATLVLAICIAALSIIGLSDMTTSLDVSDSNTEDPGFSFRFNFILLPYILLPLAIIVTVIIRWIQRLRRYLERRNLKRIYYHRKP